MTPQIAMACLCPSALKPHLLPRHCRSVTDLTYAILAIVVHLVLAGSRTLCNLARFADEFLGLMLCAGEREVMPWNLI